MLHMFCKHSIASFVENGDSLFLCLLQLFIFFCDRSHEFWEVYNHLRTLSAYCPHYVESVIMDMVNH